MKTEDLEEVILQYETPGYVFDEDRVRKNVREFYGVLGESIQLCYAMKANPFLMEALSNEVNRIEVCSYGEYQICRALSIPAEKLLISGVLKNWGELWNILNECEDRAAYTIESLSQYACISDWATRHGKRISVYLRLTSGNQFGMDEETLCNVVELELERNQLDLRGIHYFSGTQKKMKKIEKELQYLDDFMMNLKKKTSYLMSELEYGPGLAVPYFVGQEDCRLEELQKVAENLNSMQWKGKVTLEMGRAFVANAGYYFTTVKDTKRNKDINYCIVDGGMHQMNYDGQIRGMYHPKLQMFPTPVSEEAQMWTICGELCTGNDVLVQNISIPDLKVGSVLVFENTGAYSVTEGMALFLSHILPNVIMYSEQTGFRLARKRKDTYVMNMRDTK